jgi:hypothetical protein
MQRDALLGQLEIEDLCAHRCMLTSKTNCLAVGQAIFLERDMPTLDEAIAAERSARQAQHDAELTERLTAHPHLDELQARLSGSVQARRAGFWFDKLSLGRIGVAKGEVLLGQWDYLHGAYVFSFEGSLAPEYRAQNVDEAMRRTASIMEDYR